MAIIPPVDPNATVDPNSPIAPATGTLGTLFQSFYGTLSAGVQQEIWVGYLNQNNLPLDAQIPSDAVNVNNFCAYAGVPTMPPNSGIYSVIFQGLFSHLSADAQQQLWLTYLTNNGLSLTNPPTDAASVNRFLASVGASPIPPTTGDYARILQGFFGAETPEQQQLIYAQYLVNNNLSFTTPPPTDSKSLQNFVFYCSGVYLSENYDEMQSPEEIQKREIMSATFETCLQMLFNLQDTISTSGETLIFYGNWQQMYTTALTSVPTYVGGSPIAPDTTATDPTKFTFGYNNVSVDQIGQWFAQQYSNQVNNTFVLTSAPVDATVQAPVVSGFFAGHTLPVQIQYAVTLTIQANGHPTGTNTLSSTPGTITLQTQIVSVNNQPYTDPNPVPMGSVKSIAIPAGVSPNASSSNNFSLIQQAFDGAFLTDPNSFYKTLTNIPDGSLAYGISGSPTEVSFPATDLHIPITGFTDTDHINAGNYQVDVLPTFSPSNFSVSTNVNPPTTPNYVTIPWIDNSVASPTATTSSGTGAVANDDSKARAELNSRDQQYVEDLRGYRQEVQNLAQGLQANLDNSNQSVTDQADLMTSILDSIKAVMGSIFK